MKQKKMKVSIVEETPLGLYVWFTEDGKIVADEDGKISGVPGTVLEVYKNVSRATDAKTIDGAANYYKTVINDLSQWVRWTDHDGAGTNWGDNLLGANATQQHTHQ